MVRKISPLRTVRADNEWSLEDAPHRELCALLDIGERRLAFLAPALAGPVSRAADNKEVGIVKSSWASDST